MWFTKIYLDDQHARIYMYIIQYNNCYNFPIKTIKLSNINKIVDNSEINTE